MTWMAGWKAAFEGSALSTAGLTVGNMGEPADSLGMSPDMRSFSPSTAILMEDNWDSKKEWMSNGRDRPRLLTPYRLKARLGDGRAKA